MKCFISLFKCMHFWRSQIKIILFVISEKQQLQNHYTEIHMPQHICPRDLLIQWCGLEIEDDFCPRYISSILDQPLPEARESSCAICTFAYSVQFSSVAQSCPTLCNPMSRSMPGLPVHHQLPESTQNHVHQVSDAIQPSHPLSSPSPPDLNLSQHRDIFQ